MAQGSRLARWAYRLLGPAVMVLGVGWTLASVKADNLLIWEGNGDTTLPTVMQSELEAVPAESQPQQKTSNSIVEPTPVDDQNFAGEIVDPSSSIGAISQQGGQQIGLGSLGNMSVYGGGGGVGARLFGNYGTGFIRDVSAGVFGNPNQTVYNGGTTLKLFETDGAVLMTRGLFGVVNDSYLGQSNFTYSVDSYASLRLRSYGGAEHWLKFGGFVDDQNHFGKAGPMFGALLFANERFPVTFDGAVGFGYGSPIDQFPATTNVISVAARDYQLRVGTYLAPRLQVGMSSMIADWGSGPDNRNWGLGAFTNFYLFNRTMVRLDFTSGDAGFRGYAMLSYLFGPGPSVQTDGLCRVDGKDWAMQPVNRDVAVQLKERNVPFADRLNVTATVISPPRQALCTGNPNGIVEAGECFELNLAVQNPTTVAVSNVSVGQSPSTSGSAGASPQGISGATFPNLPAGGTVQTDQLTDININVPGSAASGSTIFVTFDLTVDNVTRRMTVGPIVVGQTTTGTSYAAN
ncbi:hypothetical protein K2Y11_10040 [bacterium]|nr:hypothetical protein [bacterium]